MLTGKLQTYCCRALFAICLLLSGLIVSASHENDHLKAEDKCVHGNTKCDDIVTKSSTDEEIANYTKWLFWATFALAVSGIFQFFFLLKADKTANKAVEASIAANKLNETALIRLETPRVYPVKIALSQFENRGRIAVCFKNYGRSSALIRAAYITVTISREIGQPEIFRKRKDYMVDGYIGADDTSDVIEFFDEAIHANYLQIITGVLCLNVLIHFSIEDLMNGSLESSQWFVWNWRRKKFVAGVQMWEGE